MWTEGLKKKKKKRQYPETAKAVYPATIWETGWTGCGGDTVVTAAIQADSGADLFSMLSKYWILPFHAAEEKKKRLSFFFFFACLLIRLWLCFLFCVEKKDNICLFSEPILFQLSEQQCKVENNFVN